MRNQSELRSLAAVKTPISQEALDQLFREARTHSTWLPEPVPIELLRKAYELARLGPTSANGSPARFVFLTTQGAKALLKPVLAPGKCRQDYGRSCNSYHRLGYGIVEAVGIEGPASHMGKTLPFGKIKLASLQFLRVAAELFFRRFAFLNVETRSIPLDDVAVCIAKRYFPVKHPAVFSIRLEDASFVLEDFFQSRGRLATWPKSLQRPQGERKPSNSSRSLCPK